MRNPVLCGRILDPDKATAVRRLFCTHYNLCLQEAGQKKWAGFSCHACVAYRDLTPEEKSRDHAAILTLACDLLTAEHEEEQAGDEDDDDAPIALPSVQPVAQTIQQTIQACPAVSVAVLDDDFEITSQGIRKSQPPSALAASASDDDDDFVITSKGIRRSEKPANLFSGDANPSADDGFVIR